MEVFLGISPTEVWLWDSELPDRFPEAKVVLHYEAPAGLPVHRLLIVARDPIKSLQRAMGFVAPRIHSRDAFGDRRMETWSEAFEQCCTQIDAAALALGLTPVENLAD